MNDLMGDAATIVRKAPTPAQKKAAAVAKAKATRAANKAAAERQQAQASAPLRRTAPRPPSRPEGSRDTNRETVRRGAVVTMGRNGEELTRRHIISGDPLDVPLNEIPDGWDYQWNTVTVLNRKMEEIEQGDLNMHRNGWRPVPASRHAGRWTPPGYEGSIIIDGLRLEERPKSLSIEAIEEDKARARAQVRNQTDALRLTQKQLPGAAEARGSRGGPQMGMKMSIDPALDIPHPELTLDDGFED